MPPSADSAIPAATDELAAAAAAAAASRSRPRAQSVREIATPGGRRAAKAPPRYEQESHGNLQRPSSAWVNHRECCTVKLPLALELELEPQRVYSSFSLLVGGSLASPRDLSAAWLELWSRHGGGGDTRRAPRHQLGGVGPPPAPPAAGQGRGGSEPHACKLQLDPAL